MDCIRSDESKASFQEKRAAFEQWLYSRQSQPNRLVVSFTESYPAWSTKKDFWTSEMSLSRAASRTSESSTSFIGNNSERASLSASRRRSSDRAKPTQRHNFYAVNEAGNENSTKKRDRPAARFATIHGDLLGSTANQEQYLSSTDSGCEKDGHSPPLRHRFAGDSPIRAERRSQSVRSHKSSNNAASPSSQSSGVSSGGDSAKPAPRRSFLKNLLFGHSKASSQTHLTGNSVFHQQSGSNSKQTGMAPLDTTVDGKKMKK
ncbi:hypothetical protein WR25_00437 [Diploscapter pachys]|uniref:Uncharacterized protein n=1 Tax=Diploscapter pachys TaxID=2018661 RepID=A0A2A2KY96_9BILA|nr:hypothetical protein WR25_00437 [Diploscapter pachys]